VAERQAADQQVVIDDPALLGPVRVADVGQAGGRRAVRGRRRAGPAEQQQVAPHLQHVPRPGGDLPADRQRLAVVQDLRVVTEAVDRPPGGVADDQRGEVRAAVLGADVGVLGGPDQSAVRVEGVGLSGPQVLQVEVHPGPGWCRQRSVVSPPLRLGRQADPDG
jgi:hypothetical protein